MDRNFLILTLLSSAMLATVQLATAAEPYQHAAKIDELVKPLIDSGALPSVVIGVVDSGTQWIGTYGSVTADQPLQPTADTIYEVGSVTKVFTGLLLADAVSSGECSLETTIGEIVPSIRERNPAVGSSIQLRHLATHTSGLPRLPANMQPADPQQPYADYDRRLMFEFLEGFKPLAAPGKPSGYSNLGMGLLGELLATRTRTAYENLLQDRITAPLGMTDTVIRVRDEDRPRIAPPHKLDGTPGTEWRFAAMAGAGAIRSTARDMSRWIAAHLSPPAGELGKAIELAWQQHAAAEGDAFAMGLGWHIARDGSTRWHNGQTDGYHSMLLISRELNAGVIVLSNSEAAEVDAIGEKVIRLLAGNAVEPIASAGVMVDQKILSRLDGRYQLTPAFILTVTAKNGRLFVQATGQPQLKLVAESNTKWSIQGVVATLEFDLPAEGPAPAATLFQNGAVLKATRLAD